MWKARNITRSTVEDSKIKGACYKYTSSKRKLPEIESSQIVLLLEMLDLSKNVITALPSSIGQLLNLKHLILSHCHRLLSIPKLPSKLKQIVAYGCKSLKELPKMSNLEQLEIMDLGQCSDLTEIHGLRNSLLYLHFLCKVATHFFWKTHSQNVCFRFASYLTLIIVN